MKILIGPLSLPESIVIEPGNIENPGIGGSEFHSLVLASILSEKHAVTVWIDGGSLEMSCLEVVYLPKQPEYYDLQIAFTSKADIVTMQACPLIAISHHPFDSHIEKLPKRTLAVVNVGAYQLQSNRRYAKKIGVPQVWLPIFFGRPQSHMSTRPDEFRVGHLSSLHPSKGFHDVLAGWMKFLALGGTGTLQVIGGQSLYGFTESHNAIPTSREYGEQLLRLMGGEMHSTVRFFGRVVGVGGEVSSWHVAVLNPKGFGEAATISLADCWRQGTPVIAGNRFGQRDYMSLFPELSASNPRRISELLIALKNNPELLQSYQNLSISAYQALYHRGMVSKARWLEIVTSLVDNPHSHVIAGLDTGAFTVSLRVQIMFDGLMVRAQRVASKVLIWLKNPGKS